VGRSAKSTPNSNNNVSNKRRNRPRKKNTNGRPDARRAIDWAVPKCTKHYTGVLTDPFSYAFNGPEVCIPDQFSQPTFKVSTLQRGSFKVGTSIGFVACNPWIAGSDAYNASFSDSTFTGTAISASTATTGVYTIENPNYPYGGGTTVSRNYRVVGCGLRVRYTGTELNRGGQLIACSSIHDEFNTLNGLTLSDLASRPNTRIYPVERKWRTIAYQPHWAGASDYLGGSVILPVLTGTNSKDGTRMAFMATGTTGNTFEFEIVNFYEILPTSNRSVPDTTASHSDLVGVSYLSNFIAQHVNVGNFGPEMYKKAIGYVADRFLTSMGYNTLASYGVKMLEL
jgi:hypothetical protein